MSHRPNKIETAGVLYESRMLRHAFVAIFAILAFQIGFAQDTGAVAPEPAPTDAVKVAGQRLRVEGRASTNQGVGPARLAALLDGYNQLLKHGLANGLFNTSWTGNQNEYRFFKVDAAHPAPEIISWLTRARVAEEKIVKKEKLVILDSPELGDLASAQPQLRAMVTKDVDRDGLSDMVAIGYDGSIYILKSPRGKESKVVARSPSYALMELVTGPGMERVRTVVPQGIGSVESAGNGQVRVFLELEILEMVNGELLGRATEKREVLMTVDSRLDKIRFSLSEPPDFAKLFESKAEIQGTVISEKILEEVSVQHNNKMTWEVPQGIGIRAFNFDVAQELVPGWNNFKIIAQDADGFARQREVWVQGPEAQRVAKPSTKRAVLVSLNARMDSSRLLSALSSAGFASQRVTVLRGKEATVQAVLTAIRDAKGASELLFYCETESGPGALIGGKTLRFVDGEITPIDLAQAMEAGGYGKTLAFLQTYLARTERQKFGPWELWRDTAAFSERLGNSGRLVVANVENPKQSPRKLRKLSQGRLLKALLAPSGSDLGRLLDPSNVAGTVFRGWMFGRPVMSR